MCTLTIIPTIDDRGRPNGYRAIMSRDEVRSRPAARRPEIRSLDPHRAIWPTDSEAGGTWVGASESGLALALLNVNLGRHEPPSSGVRTRGELIPKLIEEASIASVASELRDMPLDRYRPFRLVAMSREGVIDARWDRRLLVETVRRLEPACFVSSGLGDHFVEPRLMLFESMVRGVYPSRSVQDAYHRHVWSGHEHVSVMMSRENARTTSVTTVEMQWHTDDRPTVTMVHQDDDGASRHALDELAVPAT